MMPDAVAARNATVMGAQDADVPMKSKENLGVDGEYEQFEEDDLDAADDDFVEDMLADPENLGSVILSFFDPPEV